LPQIGPLEILVIFIVALVVFGPSKLPQIGRQVGRGFREFRKFQAGLRDDIEDAFREDDEDDDVDDDQDDEPKQLGAGRPESSGAEARPPDPGKRTEPPPADTAS
jgi:TatA/E family protein of Tat protein translocase